MRDENEADRAPEQAPAAIHAKTAFATAVIDPRAPAVTIVPDAIHPEDEP